MAVEKRAGDRDECDLGALIEVGSVCISCFVENISESGARLRIDANRQIPENFTLTLPKVDDHYERRPVTMRWRVGSAVGVRFTDR